jgi:hypothetical protein
MGKLHPTIGHPTPTDHAYHLHDKIPQWEQEGGQGAPWVPPYDVRVPADGLITHIEGMGFQDPPHGFWGTSEDYRIIIWHSCTVATIYIHLGGLAPEILQVTGPIAERGHWSGKTIPV